MKSHGRCRFALLGWMPTFFFLLCISSVPFAESIQAQTEVEVVSIPNKPLLTDPAAFLTELWSFSGDDWGAPARVHADSGRILVVDPMVSRIHVLSSSGEPLTSFGKDGGGPGEFQQLHDAFLDGGRILVLDVGKLGLQFLSPDGTYLSSLPLKPAVYHAISLGDDEYLVSGQFGLRRDPFEIDQRGRAGGWVRVSKDQEPVQFADPMEPLPEEREVRCARFYPWPGGAARLRMTTPQIQVFDRTGHLLKELRIEIPVRPTTEAQRNAALAAMREGLQRDGAPPQFAQQQLTIMDERYQVECRFGPLRTSSNSRIAALLEETPAALGDGNAILHFLSPDGVYLARAAFPTPWVDFALDGDGIYALSRDPATGLISLEAFQVDFPDSVFSGARGP